MQCLRSTILLTALLVLLCGVSVTANAQYNNDIYYCSTDGRAYAQGQGGILCPSPRGTVPVCPNGYACNCIDTDGSCTDGDDDWGYRAQQGSSAATSQPIYYCSNDGASYASGMGGILCPGPRNAVPICPHGYPCTCIDGDGSCTDGDDDWGYTPVQQPPAYATPTPAYGQPYRPPAGSGQPGYPAPQPGYAPPHSGYTPPPVGYQPPAAGYRPPPAGAVAPPAGYVPPPPGYTPPPARYVPPSTGYTAPPANVYRPPRNISTGELQDWQRYLGAAGHKAFAKSATTGRYGWGTGKSSPNEAQQTAIRECIAVDCKVISVNGQSVHP
ncbi:MAG: hypothetical protein ACI9BW_001659 [Gammaproteobacteria bacterium]|jgi:hypothetical protein